ncbi:hypothetical protein [Pseudomonas sp. R5(2019)]|uniref:hypothetical protein n=1 Tax=Pseudomonas sp. R5(2019) TaxID=2697566 RepID=UPI0014131C23|nr:hypothetical protein [Pseudomonas sp. R5(2019)]NBA96843.1 hypothetical protein [Pseudomonas sp. R5(2019)]
MSTIPEGTVLGEGQSWNAQHGYVQTKGAMCDRPALLVAFAASGVSETLPWLKEQAANGVAVPPYATFRLWAAAKKLKTTPSPSKAPAPAVPNSPEAIKAEIARLQEAYKESLLSKVDRLKSEIEKMQQELAAAEKELKEITA